MQNPIIRDKFKYGAITSLGDQNIPNEASSGSSNWFTKGEDIELRRGQARLGLTENTGSGQITGSIKAIKADGTEVYFRSRGRKIEYYIPSTDDFGENGTDVLPSAASGEQITFALITTVTGPQVWLNSPNSGLHKIMVANPGSITAMYDGTKNYRGYITIRGSAIWLWNAKIDSKVPDLVNPYRSYLANKSPTDFTQISAEAIGSSGSLTYTGTLAFKAAGTKRTCFEVTFTDGVETFVDDLSGGLTGSLGGTGTINYTTGAYSVTFFSVAAGSVTSTYRWEDSTSTGLADFTFSGTRTSGQGLVLRQADGGFPIKNVFVYANKFYVFHTASVWVITISADDLDFDNQIFRNNVGIPSIYGACETAKGIHYIDVVSSSDPQIRKLAFDISGTEVIPQSVSKAFKLNNQNVGLDLTPYNFDNSFFIEFGNLVAVFCKLSDSTYNDKCIVINQDSKSLDVMSGIYGQTAAIYNDALIIGESISNNSITIFSGYDDQEDDIDNYWDSKNDDLGILRLKKANVLLLEGNIGPDQKIRAYINDDQGNFVEILDDDGGAFIDGTGTYVDKSQRVTIGSITLGRTESSDGVEAYHYQRELKVKLDRFQKRKIRFKADGIGWASVSKYVWKDIRIKWQKPPTKYR